MLKDIKAPTGGLNMMTGATIGLGFGLGGLGAMIPGLTGL